MREPAENEGAYRGRGGLQGMREPAGDEVAFRG